MNKKQAKTMRKGYREAGQLYWTDEMAAILKKKNRELLAYRAGTDEMAAILKKKNRELLAYRAGFVGCLAFALFVAVVHVL